MISPVITQLEHMDTFKQDNSITFLLINMCIERKKPKALLLYLKNEMWRLNNITCVEHLLPSNNQICQNYLDGHSLTK